MKFTWIFLLRFVLIFLPSLLFAISIFFLSYSYEKFTYSIFEQLGQLDKLEKFRNTMLTGERFFLLRILSICSTIVAIFLAVYLWKQLYSLSLWWNKLINYFKTFFFKIIQLWQGISFFEKTAVSVLLVCVIISRLYFLLRFPFHIDERFSYLYFVREGLGVSLAYYPNPNNHILYTFFCNVAQIFINEPVLIMKVPSFLFGICLTILFWGIIRHYFNSNISLLASTLFSFSDQVFYYGMQGRGYTLLLIFTLIAIASLLRIINSQQLSLSSYGWFWISATLGFYTIPIFLYPFGGMVAFTIMYLIKQRAIQKIKWLVIAVLLITISVLLLYLPVFLFNGFTAISGNSWVAPLSLKTFIAAYPANLLDLNANLWGDIPSGAWLTLIILVYCFYMLLNKRESLAVRQWSMLFMVCLIVTIIISLLQRVLLYQRVIIYLSIFQYVLLAILTTRLIYLLSKNVKARFIIIYSVCLLIIASTIYTFYQYTSSEKFDQYDSFDATANILYQKNADNIFVNYYEYSLCIRFKYETSGKDVIMDTIEPIPGDTYKFLVIHKSKPIPPQFSGLPYTKIYEDTEVVVYEKG